MRWDSTWALNTKVFWKGNIRQHGGTRYLRVILKDEEVHLVNLYFGGRGDTISKSIFLL